MLKTELQNINFEKLESVRRQCITFAKDGNTIVKPYKTLYNVEQITGNTEHKTLYFEVVKGKETWEEDSYCLFEDLGKICSKVDWIPKYWTMGEFTEKLAKWGYLGTEGLFKRLKESEENGWYINLLDIQLCVILDKLELAKHYAEYRENRIKVREEKETKERAEREMMERIAEEKHKAEVQKIIDNAEANIFSQVEVDNEEVDGVSVINHLMRRYEINVPLRTQGWVNTKLAKIVFNDGKISYKFYGRSQRDNSTVFKKYLVELETAINNKLAIPFC